LSNTLSADSERETKEEALTVAINKRQTSQRDRATIYSPMHGFYSTESFQTVVKGKGSQYSITERRVPELIPVLGSQPAGDVSHKPGGRLPLLSARPAVTPATFSVND